MSTSGSLSESEVWKNGIPHGELLPATSDNDGGVIVDMQEPMDSDAFLTALRTSMLKWKRQGKKGVWIRLPIGLANLVETAVREGFGYHHAEPTYLMLVYWIPKTENTLPPNASHRVGVGAIVFNENRELLVVQEKTGRFRGTGFWKIPTGIVEQGEDIFKAVVREVKEETGIDTEFLEVLGLRQSHKSFFEKSDLFIICMLRPLSFDLQMQEQEIDAVQWMPFEEYAAQPFAQKHERFRYITELCLAKLDRAYAGFFPQPISSASIDGLSYLYFSNKNLHQPSSADPS
ncbi:hypothetical protein SLA2020_058060 [Shorea laevis]